MGSNNIDIAGWKVPNFFNREGRAEAVDEAKKKGKAAVNTVTNAQKEAVDQFTSNVAKANKFVANKAKENLPPVTGAVVAAPFEANAETSKKIQQLNQAQVDAVQQGAGNVIDANAAILKAGGNAVE